MQVIQSLLTNASADLTRTLMGALLLLLIPTLYFFIARARSTQRAGKTLPLRSIPALDTLPDALGRAAESDRPVHISLGSGAVGDVSTAESLAGLLLLDRLAQKAATYDAHPIVTTADAALMLAAQDRLRGAYARQGVPAGYDSSRVRLVAPDRGAYAAGVTDILNHEALSGNVMLGAFGDEYLLMGETNVRKGLPLVAGATDPNVLSLVYSTTQEPLLGEEIFAAAAYVGRLPAHVGSLLAQDWVRILLVLVIIAGVIISSLS